jgi:hypothetical protein
LLETPEPRAAKGPPPGGASGSPNDGVLRDFAAGYDAASFGMRASGAQTTTPPGVSVRGEPSHHQVRGRPRKDGEHELEPPVAALRSEHWVANESLRRCVAMTSAPQHLRVTGPTRWTFLSGQIHWHFVRHDGMRPRCLLREMPEPPRPAAISLRGDSLARVAGARQGRNTLPSLDVRVQGHRSGSGRQVKRPAETLGSANRAAASGTSRSKAQGSIERARSGNVARIATDSSAEESPEVGEQRGAPWRHGSGHSSERREGTPVGERDRVRKDETR